jgi:glycosyltransferase involved in cell wall biosynthesis
MHLHELLEAFPVQAEACIALPFDPAADDPNLDGLDARCIAVKTSDTVSGNLLWEQRALPAIARRVQARCIHTLSYFAPQFSPAPVIVSPAANFDRPSGFRGRLRFALGVGGQSQAQTVLWPGDLPVPARAAAWRHVLPFVHSAFSRPQSPPRSPEETYVIVPGELDEKALHLLAAAWSWAEAGLGEACSLVVCDLDGARLEKLRSLCRDAGTAAPVSALPAAAPAQRAALFQHARAVLILTPIQPWGDSLLQALAAARPIIAEESTLVSARVGPAGYLVPAGDARAIGAALITVVGEADVEQQLCDAARARSAGWTGEEITLVLREAYGL